MANAVYQSPVLNTQAKQTLALQKASELFAHLAAGSGGYTMSFVSADVGITLAQVLTITLSAPLPDQPQTDRYLLTRIA